MTRETQIWKGECCVCGTTGRQGYLRREIGPLNFELKDQAVKMWTALNQLSWDPMAGLFEHGD
jgi:hypothetical protein